MDSDAHLERGRAFYEKWQLTEAVGEFTTAIGSDPEQLDDFVFSSCAWILATCPDDRCRNATEAVRMATTACELVDWLEEQPLGVLAAAYAASGDFPAAVKWQAKACELAEGQRQELQRGRLAAYEAGKALQGGEGPWMAQGTAIGKTTRDRQAAAPARESPSGPASRCGKVLYNHPMGNKNRKISRQEKARANRIISEAYPDCEVVWGSHGAYGGHRTPRDHTVAFRLRGKTGKYTSNVVWLMPGQVATLTVGLVRSLVAASNGR